MTAMTGMDALVHAIESFVGVRASVFTDTLNLQAIHLVAANLRLAYANGDNRAARENMQHASCLAGMAFSNTQNGLDHAMALAIGGKFHLPHGQLTAFILPWVMEFNLIAAPQKCGNRQGVRRKDRGRERNRGRAALGQGDQEPARRCGHFLQIELLRCSA